MAKEKVFIVISHKHVPKSGSHPGRGKHSKIDWEVAEQVEFVSHLKNRHKTSSSAIGDYINKKMITGARYGMDEYTKFENYVRQKYAKQMAELDAAYGNDRVEGNNETELITDSFGNLRVKTVFDA